MLRVPDLAARQSPAPNPQKDGLRTVSFGNFHWQNQIHKSKFLQTLGCPSPGLAPVKGEGSTYDVCMLKSWWQESQGWKWTPSSRSPASQLELGLLILV